MITDDLQRSKNRSRKDESWSTPDPGPEKQGQADCERIKSQAGTDYAGANPVHGDGMNCDHGDDPSQDSALKQCAGSASQGWQQCQKHAAIWNQRHESADDTDEVEVRDSEAPA
jgi:hypothetical protein